MKFYETKKGQVLIAIITAVTAITASIVAAFATSNNRVSEIDKQVTEVKVTENLHYQEIQKQLTALDKKFDGVNDKLDLLLKKK